MRHTTAIAVLGFFLFTNFGCDQQNDPNASLRPTSSRDRAERRAFAGAPPVIPHPPLSGKCTTCHTPTGGKLVTDIGIAPANPHTQTPGMSEQSRCKQCHIFHSADEIFVASEFTLWTGLPNVGVRAHAKAPPTVPHEHFMREDCAACHSGTAARLEILCRHAERLRCEQCHVQQDDSATDGVLFTAIDEE